MGWLMSVGMVLYVFGAVAVFAFAPRAVAKVHVRVGVIGDAADGAAMEGFGGVSGALIFQGFVPSCAFEACIEFLAEVK